MSVLPRTSREIQLAVLPDGLPRPEHFELVEVPIPVPGGGEALVRNLFFHVPAALRTVIGGGLEGAPFPAVLPGDTLFGAAIGEVVSAPEASGLRAGELVSHWLGWREYAALPVAACTPLGDVLPDPVAHLAQGWTPFGALTRGAAVREGDTVFVTGGAGSVGSLAGQIARLLGAGRVVGSTGSPHKAERMIAELGYDAVVVRGVEPIGGQLAKAAPQGIDVLIDNVGGEQLRAAVAAARPGARFALVGALSGQLSAQGDGTTAPVEIDYGQADVDRVKVIRQLLALGMTVQDLQRCADRLHLLPGDSLPPSGRPESFCTSSDGIISRRLASLDAEIARLTGLRELLYTAIDPAPPLQDEASAGRSTDR